MAVTGDAQLGLLKQTAQSTLVQRELKNKGVLVPLVTDVSQFATKGSSAISFPSAGSFTVQNRPSGQMATIQNLTFGLEKLDLDFRATVSWIIDSMDEVQVNLDLQGIYAVRAAAAHAREIDKHIIAELNDSAQAVAGATGVTDASLLAVRKALRLANGDMTNMAFLLGPEAEESMLKIDKFVRADAYGSPVIPNGLIGRYYGMDAFVSNDVEGDDFYVFDKSAVVIGFQREPRTDDRKAPEYGTGSLLKTMDMLYGTAALQKGVNGAPAGKSALVFKNA